MRGTPASTNAEANVSTESSIGDRRIHFELSEPCE
jgi:hypothetical protein